MIKSQFANIVLVPINFRVDLASQIWLVKNGLVKEESNGFFTPVAVQCEDDEVQVLVLNNRIQIMSKIESVTEGIRDAASRMTKFMSAAGGTLGQLEGVGANCQVVLDVAEPGTIERAFFRDSNLSRRAGTNRELSLTVNEISASGSFTTKIQMGKHNDTGEPGLVIDFNSHADASDSSQVREFLSKVDEIAAVCTDYIDMIKSDVANQGGV